MLRKVKNVLYFTIARYFRFFARIRLAAWKPRVVVITGSNGKTSALHLVEVQLGSAAKYSHNANSSFGIPFDILGLKRVTYSPLEWIEFALRAPVQAFKKPYAEKIYIVEADCDRPGEGQFLSSLLMPEVTMWLNSARTHSQNYEKSVGSGKFPTIEGAIAYEFGYFLERTSKLVILNTDNPLISGEMKRAEAELYEIKEHEQLEKYEVRNDGSEFRVGGAIYRTSYLLPKETFYAISASVKIAEYFGKQPTADLSKLAMPPGRSSVFKGVKNTTIIDSSYNVNVDSISAVLHMVERLSSDKKWLVLGDLTEQGTLEQGEHEKIARLLLETDFQRIVLVGPRLARFALPILKTSLNGDVVSFIHPKDALDYLLSSIGGGLPGQGEMLVFKGARFLEGIIERLLQDKRDADKLCRREKIWQVRRQKWGL